MKYVLLNGEKSGRAKISRRGVFGGGARDGGAVSADITGKLLILFKAEFTLKSRNNYECFHDPCRKFSVFCLKDDQI